jgi:hypothetical protein
MEQLLAFMSNANKQGDYRYGMIECDLIPAVPVVNLPRKAAFGLVFLNTLNER